MHSLFLSLSIGMSSCMFVCLSLPPSVSVSLSLSVTLSINGCFFLYFICLPHIPQFHYLHALNINTKPTELKLYYSNTPASIPRFISTHKRPLRGQVPCWLGVNYMIVALSHLEFISSTGKRKSALSENVQTSTNCRMSISLFSPPKHPFWTPEYLTKGGRL